MNYRVIPLTQGFVAIIDSADFRQVNKYKWHTSFSKGNKRKIGQPYARANIDGKKVYLHRFIVNANSEMHVDHKNHQTLDCRRENLKESTPLDNQRTKRNYKKRELQK